MASKKVGYAKYRLSPLKKITDEAKRIRKSNPNMKWTDAIKRAGAIYRGGTVAKKAVSKKRTVRKKAAVKGKTQTVKKTVARKKTTTIKRNVVSGSANNLSKVTATGKELSYITECIARLKFSMKGQSASEKSKIKTIIKSKQAQFVSLKKYFNTIAKFK